MTPSKDKDTETTQRGETPKGPHTEAAYEGTGYGPKGPYTPPSEGDESDEETHILNEQGVLYRSRWREGRPPDEEER